MCFLEEMNLKGANMGLKDSFFDSAHGLSNWNNWASALDICKLCGECMKNEEFRKIVGTKVYRVFPNQ